MKTSDNEDKPLSEHLEDLRGVLWRCIAAWGVASVVAFCCKTPLFSIVFAPSRGDFFIFRGMEWLSQRLHWSALAPPDHTPSFVATELTAQFMTHLTVSLAAGFVLVSPYIIAKLYGFVAPALYASEKRAAVGIVTVGTVLFWMGVLLNYFVIFPFAYRFLSTYQVQPDVANQITISSYISLFLILSLLMGVLFPSMHSISSPSSSPATLPRVPDPRALCCLQKQTSQAIGSPYLRPLYPSDILPTGSTRG